MERPKIKSINFDLDTKQMKKLSVYPNGYYQLGKSLIKQGFEHRQGSGYISKTKCIDADITDIIRNVTKENPWLKDCINKIDVTDVGKQYDLTQIVKSVRTSKNVQKISPQLQEMQARAKQQRMQQQKYQAKQKAKSKQNDGNYMG